jgi:hypothetical protein
MVEYIELNATSTFLQNAFIKANANGYITSVNAQVGKIISAGQNVFILKTKEAQSIGNAINVLDSSFKFSGIIHIKVRYIRLCCRGQSPGGRLCAGG